MGNQLIREQIIEILESDYCDGGPTIGSIADKIKQLVNQEVEKRIVERMPSEEEMESEIDRSPADMAFAGGFAECYEWLRSRLVSQKTDNLKENNNNGSTN
jgi:hypothetical protein